MAENAVNVIAQVSVHVRDRAKAVAKKTRTTVSQLVRDGLLEKVEFHEKRLRAEEEQRQADKEAKKIGRTLRGIGERLVEKNNTPASIPINTAPDETETEIEEPVVDPLDEVYDYHAERIFRSLDSPLEKRLCIAEALAAVRSRAPLTSPKDSVVLEILEKRILKLRSAAKEDEIKLTIDPKRVRSFGDIDKK